MNTTELSVADLSALLKKRELTATEVVRACLERIRATENLNNFITVCEDAAIAAATEADNALNRGAATSVLCGVPIAVKDNIATAGIRTTCASRTLENYVPSSDAAVVKKLKAAGAIIIGKTNMDEFAMGSTNENSAFGAAKNAKDTTRVTGGSSGGSANCVAARQAFCAIGSDTGGSARQPAAYCGVVGLKPTFGAIDCDGLIGFAPSLDCVGLIARDCDDVATLFASLYDGTAGERNKYCGLTEVDLRGMTVGVADEFMNVEYLDEQALSAYNRALTALRDAGAKTVRVGLPSFAAGIAAYHVISSAEAANSYKQIKRTMRDGAQTGAEFKRRIITGEYVTDGARYEELYVKAARVRAVIRSEYLRALQTCDVLICPTAPNVAPKIGEKLPPDVSHYNDMYAAPVSLAGLPAVSVPFGTAHGMPVGMQIIGRHNAEYTILAVGKQLALRDK